MTGIKEPEAAIIREYPKFPLVGAGTVIRRDNEVLLIKRAAPPKAGYYSIPGGLVELGEKVEDAAKREALEETGLIVEIEKLIAVIDNIIRDEGGRVKYHYILVDYLAKPVGGELKVSSDATEAGWFRFEDLRDLKMTNTALILFENLGYISSRGRRDQ